MKIKLLLVVLAVCTFSILNAVEIPLSDSSGKPTTRSLTFIPVIVDYTEPDLTMEFQYNTGNTTVTITDDSGLIVYQNTVFTTQGSELAITTEYWNNGNYNIMVQIGLRTYIGSFDIAN